MPRFFARGKYFIERCPILLKKRKRCVIIRYVCKNNEKMTGNGFVFVF